MAGCLLQRCLAMPLLCLTSNRLLERTLVGHRCYLPHVTDVMFAVTYRASRVVQLLWWASVGELVCC